MGCLGHTGVSGKIRHQFNSYRPPPRGRMSESSNLKADQLDIVSVFVMVDIIDTMQTGGAVARHTAGQPLIDAEGVVLAGWHGLST